MWVREGMHAGAGVVTVLAQFADRVRPALSGSNRASLTDHLDNQPLARKQQLSMSRRT